LSTRARIAVAGGYVTYRLAEKGEEETLERRIGQNTAKKLYQHFKMHGFATVAIAALLPPPLPTKPILLIAGALHYPDRNFLGALTLGRAIRYLVVGYAAHIYGHAIATIFSQYSGPILYAFITLVILGAILGLIYLKWFQPRKKRQEQPQR
jgi:membrane protein YqaA with SNARE-associated domain